MVGRKMEWRETKEREVGIERVLFVWLSNASLISLNWKERKVRIYTKVQYIPFLTNVV